MYQIFLAVEHMHSHGVVHRDLKVGKIMLIADLCIVTDGLYSNYHVQVNCIFTEENMITLPSGYNNALTPCLPCDILYYLACLTFFSSILRYN